MCSKLPAMTISLLNFSKWLNRNLLWILLIIVVGAFLIYRFAVTDRGKDIIDGVRVKLPVFGNIWLKYQVALFARTLSTLRPGGLPLAPALEAAARSISSRRVSKAVTPRTTAGREGRSARRRQVSTSVR